MSPMKRAIVGIWIVLTVVGLALGCRLCVKTAPAADAEFPTIRLAVNGKSVICALPQELSELLDHEGLYVPLHKYTLSSPDRSQFSVLDLGICQFYVYCYAGYPYEENADCAVQLIRMPHVNVDGYLIYRWWLHSFARDGLPKVEQVSQDAADWWIKLFKGEVYPMLPKELVAKRI